MRKIRNAFTMLELIFVIVIMGILSKFGVEFLVQSYKNYTFSTINNTLQSNSATTLEFIASRLQYRIKDSVIGKDSDNLSDFKALGSATGNNYDVLEWVGSDIDGFRGDTNSTWSGIIDVGHASASDTVLVSPGTNTAEINSLIATLSNSNSDINDSAIYFIGADSDVQTGYGWDGTAIADQQATMHPIENILTQPNQFAPRVGTFSGTEIFEYYKLAWSAYALILVDYDADGDKDDLMLYSDYQPWDGKTYDNAHRKDLLMKNVDTFQFMAIGSIIKVQICVNTDLVEDYSICKEKTIY